MIPDESVTSELQGKWLENRRSSNDINFGFFLAQGLRQCVEEIVFAYTYPRLDMEVGLICVYVLGRVCTLIDPQSCDEFDPTAVPTLSEVSMYMSNDFLSVA
ncbi:hypothetical protein Pint_14998 [Pistacia integerrima]|uniref:Uncharacterized protein n=1 Tax=Pistacia integerrima TaxID=434235 RepID=A0ACC0ZB25_9ROSI|nr:hypothetical protein Pint_14998 [Pistacia integerrima]